MILKIYKNLFKYIFYLVPNQTNEWTGWLRKYVPEEEYLTLRNEAIITHEDGHLTGHGSTTCGADELHSLGNFTITDGRINIRERGTKKTIEMTWKYDKSWVIVIQGGSEIWSDTVTLRGTIDQNPEDGLDWQIQVMMFSSGVSIGEVIMRRTRNNL